MSKLEFEYVMRKITAGLTGDPAKDIPYLKQMSETYKNSEYAKEILRACGRLMFSVLPDDKKAEISRLTENHLLGIESVLDEAQFNIYRQKFDVAKKILSAAVANVEKFNMYQDDAVSEYHSFNTLIEEILYTHIYNPKKDLRQAPEPLSNLYLTFGCVLFELKDFDAAEVALKKAMRWNPIDPRISFEYAELFKQNGDMNSFYKFTLQIFPRIYSSEHLARCYRNLGYYFVERRLWKVAAGCYLLSINYSTESKQAQSELWYIQQKAGENFSLPTPEDVKRFAEQYKFPLGADEDVVGIAVELGKHAFKNGQLDAAKYFFGIAYDLTNVDELKEILDTLDD